ncbi:hypothetical protein [Burkholderia contaminans]|uniref:hypothetical protein n=1 Tax=Burkholderia contaminans TaxID=488447 RepID=UPI001FC8456F|nr:hypothetical protein [Burkholderia contaminans]
MKRNQIVGQPRRNRIADEADPIRTTPVSPRAAPASSCARPASVRERLPVAHPSGPGCLRFAAPASYRKQPRRASKRARIVNCRRMNIEIFIKRSAGLVARRLDSLDQIIKSA